ncbi:NADPH-dependent diflavin oxidoreductase 1 [Cladochytrium tenue]|nr:NADPH-dependent diflavin oxidoreductase 1 [Cladochytrium tenue]
MVWDRGGADAFVNRAAQNHLFLGVRSRAGDFLFESDWAEMAARGCLKLVTAFSRDQEEKIYIQHRIVEHAGVVWDVIQRGGYVYLSGNAKNIPAAVTDALKAAVRACGGAATDSDAAEVVARLEREHRFQTESWS